MPVTRARARQPGTALTSRTTGPSRAGSAIRSTPATSAADRGGRRDRQALLFGRGSIGFGLAAQGDVRPPLARRCMASHRAQHAAVEDEDADVVTGVRYGPLEIKHGADAFQGVERSPGQLAIADAYQAAALGAEQRLDDDVAAEHVESRQGGRGRLAGPGRRDGQAGRVEEGQRQVLVDGRLDRSRRVEHGDARRGDPVQGIHPEDDLLEAARRHHPHEHAVDSSSARGRRLAPPRPVRTGRGGRDLGEGDGHAGPHPSRPAARCRSATCQPDPGNEWRPASS